MIATFTPDDCQECLEKFEIIYYTDDLYNPPVEDQLDFHENDGERMLSIEVPEDLFEGGTLEVMLNDELIAGNVIETPADQLESFDLQFTDPFDVFNALLRYEQNGPANCEHTFENPFFGIEIEFLDPGGFGDEYILHISPPENTGENETITWFLNGGVLDPYLSVGPTSFEFEPTEDPFFNLTMIRTENPSIAPYTLTGAFISLPTSNMQSFSIPELNIEETFSQEIHEAAIALRYTAPSGLVYSTLNQCDAEFAQPASSFFEILSVVPFGNSPSGHNTVQCEISSEALLYSISDPSDEPLPLDGFSATVALPYLN